MYTTKVATRGGENVTIEHDFFENQGVGFQLVYPGAHPGCGNVAAIEVIEPLP